MKNIKSIITFRCMITPYIVQLFFWLFVIMLIMVGIRNILGHGNIIISVMATALGICCSRVICECLIVIFRANETLQDIRIKLQQ